MVKQKEEEERFGSLKIAMTKKEPSPNHTHFSSEYLSAISFDFLLSAVQKYVLKNRNKKDTRQATKKTTQIP